MTKLIAFIAVVFFGGLLLMLFSPLITGFEIGYLSAVALFGVVQVLTFATCGVLKGLADG